MSLKNYVFLMLAILLSLVAAVQLFMFDMIEKKIAEEITQKSEAISDVALRSLTQVAASKPSEQDEQLRIIIKNTPNKIVDLGDGIRFKTGDETQTISIATSPEQTIIAHAPKEISFKQVGTGFQVLSADEQSGIVSQHVVQFNTRDSALALYFHVLSYITGAVLLAGLLFAYWLAHHISRPLRSLSNGFNALEQGQLGAQIPVSGVAEVQTTLEKFNHTSQQLKALENVQQRLREHQQMAELGEVARGLAHSLRNPLNTIGLAVEQMLTSNVSEQQQVQLAANIRTKIQQMDRSIQSLMQLSKGDISRDENVVVSDIIDDIRLELSTSSKVLIAFQPNRDITLRCAQTELRTMLHVLLSNAVEACSDGGEVTINATREDNTLIIVVTDTGCGIPNHIEDKIAQPHITGKAEGAGMGLFIVKRLAHLYYDGQIEVINNPNQGVTATLTLHDAQDEDSQND